MEFEKLAEKMLHRINNERKECYLKGDLSMDLLKINQSPAIQNILNQFISSFFYPQITKPTRKTHKSATLIDSILTNGLNEDDLGFFTLIYLITHLSLP